MPEEFVTPNTDLQTLEKDVKNKFKWKWLEETDCHGDLLSSYIQKLKLPGFAFCCHCNMKVDYSKKGKSAIKRHAESAAHKKKRNCSVSNQSLPAAFKIFQTIKSGQPTLPVSSQSSSVSEHTNQPQPPPLAKTPSFKDRVAHQEAILCSFVVEHSLALSISPHLIELAQTLAQDPKALQALKMERQTMTYKLKHGLYEVERKRLVEKLRTVPFSINLDESTSKHNKKRILNVLVCLFDEELGKSVTHVYSAMEMIVVNAKTVFNAVISKFKEDNIPLSNLISTLTDSAAYMRGSESGFQTKLREEHPHVIDIDGDLCHHIHNVSRHFCLNLDPNSIVAKLIDDIYKDFMWSPDIRQDYSSICKLLGMQDPLPKERVGVRWLSMLESCRTLETIKEPLTVLYFAWLSQADKEIYKEQIIDIFKAKSVCLGGTQSIYAILRRLKAKNLTQMGKQRKQRIARKLFDMRRELEFNLGCFLSILPMFQKFILLFQQNTPMIHKLHDRMVDVFTDFLRHFVRAEHIRESAKDLASLNLDDNALYMSPRHIECGQANCVLSTMPPDQTKVFRKRLLSTYIGTAKYMQSKLPLKNSILRLFSFLDPLAFGQTDTAIVLKSLPAFFPTIPSEGFATEIIMMQSDCNIQTGQDTPIDEWWSQVFKLKKYPSVKRVVSGCLSVFTGPKVEASFSLMNNIITKTSSCMMISHYEAFLSLKYKLLNLNTTTCKLYHRPDPIHSPVDHSLAYHMQTAHSRYQAAIKKRKEEQAKKDKALFLPMPQDATEGRKRKGCQMQSCPRKRAKL